MQWNCSTLNNKLPEFRTFLETNSFDVVVVNETRITRPQQTSKFKNYLTYTDIKNNGTLMPVKRNIPSYQVTNNSDIENVTVKLKNGLHIIGAYFHPFTKKLGVAS